MSRPNPIVVALNMHSAYDCTRYFVFHAASGTSPAYAATEQQFIGYVQDAFPGGVQPWNYFVSWTSGASTVYPESWFWYNHGEKVLALTYEDKNCPAAGGYDSTALAILHGIRNQLFGPTAVANGATMPEGFFLAQNYPNPFNPKTVIRLQVAVSAHVNLSVYDILGRNVAVLVDEKKEPGIHEVKFDGSGLPSGMYVYRMTAGTTSLTKRMMPLK